MAKEMGVQVERCARYDADAIAVWVQLGWVRGIAVVDHQKDAAVAQ